MLKNKLSRKDFLKTAAGILAGLTTLNFTKKFLNSAQRPAQPSDAKEARYYKRSDRLAG